MKKLMFYLMMFLCSSVFSSCDEIVNNALQKGIEDAKKDLPIEIAEGIVADDITLGENGIVYHVTVSEETYDMDVLKENSAELKNNIIESFKESIHDDQEIKDFLKTAVEFNKPLNYKYEGDTSGNIVRIKINVNELKEVLAN